MEDDNPLWIAFFGPMADELQDVADAWEKVRQNHMKHDEIMRHKNSN